MPTGKETLTVASNKCLFQKCDGSGLIVVVEGGETKAYICPCTEQKRQLRRLNTAQIPLDFQNTTVSSFEYDIYDEIENIKKAKVAKHFAIKFVENYKDLSSIGKGIYLYSAIKGSGKTRLAVSILNALINKYHVSGLYISSVNMLNEIKNTFNGESNSNSYELLKKFGEVDVLLIDDLGVEKVSDWSEEIFTQILETRMNAKKITIVTSNIKINELDMKYTNGRVGSRIEKVTFPIQLPEESVRTKLANRENDEIFNKFFK